MSVLGGTRPAGHRTRHTGLHPATAPAHPAPVAPGAPPARTATRCSRTPTNRPETSPECPEIGTFRVSTRRSRSTINTTPSRRLHQGPQDGCRRPSRSTWCHHPDLRAADHRLCVSNPGRRPPRQGGGVTTQDTTLSRPRRFREIPPRDPHPIARAYARSLHAPVTGIGVTSVSELLTYIGGADERP